MTDTRRQIAESLGYRAIERRPRGSLNTFYEIVAPDGTVYGSASGSQSDPAALIDLAWEDALTRLLIQPASDAPYSA